MKHRFLIFILSALLAPLASAQDPFGEPAFLTKETIAVIKPEVSQIEPGDFFQVAFILDLQPKFHAYFKNAGSAGSPPAVEWELPDGFTAGELQFPLPKAFKSKSTGVETVGYGYEGKVTFVTEVTVDENLEQGKEFTIKGNFNWQECDETCILGDKDFSFTIKTADDRTVSEADEAFFEEVGKKLPSDSSAWGFLASEQSNMITLKAIFPEGLEPSEPVYFFSTDQQIDSQAAQKVEIGKNEIILNLDRNGGNDELFISPGKVQETLSGLLTVQTEYGPIGLEVAAPFIPDADVKMMDGPGEKVIKASKEDREAGLALYDADARPDVVLLGGAKEKEVTFISSLGLVFLGGLILNLMPCVFPVLGLKIMGFVSQAGEDEDKIKVHGLVFGLGLLITMWILAAFIISLELDWGQQLANPIFLGTMIIVFFLMGLNLYGVFEIGTSMTSVGGELQTKKGYSGSFFSGALTTLVATPCSGPFLGAVMAFALSQDNKAIQFAVFTVFGLGIASPYILLSFFPALIKKLPRPGAWMETFKQVMAFFVFATAVFFMKGYLKLVGDDHFNVFLFALCLIGLGVYVYGRYGNQAVAKTKRLVTGFGLAGLMTMGGLTWAYSTAKPPEPGLAWNEWYPGIMEQSRSKKRIIWVDYTADW
ncbi:protein-disulfide reductase DsbD family protein [Akkermansiaceae bacterium]|nr:protein-disulfide reductase DsbD family protein [Akkermansiaceae bacterium]